MKQFFKINEISKLYNIGPDSLRYYEKLGLLAPKRGKNNYRLYTLDDLWRLNIIRDLRRLGFPMEKIREYMDNRSVENTRKLLTEELDIIHQQIQELNRLQKNVEERLLTLSGAEDQALLKIRLQTFPDRYCHTLHIPYHTDEEMDLLVKQLLNKNTENLYIISNHNIGSFLPLEERKDSTKIILECLSLIIRESIVSAAVLILPSPMQVITVRTPLIFRNFSTMQMVMVLFLMDLFWN